MSSLAVTYFKPYQPGIERTVSGFRFALVNKKNGCESGILLYDDKKQEQRIPLSEKGRKGELFGVEIRGEDLNQLTYNFYNGDDVFMDRVHEHCEKKWDDNVFSTAVFSRTKKIISGLCTR